MGLSKRARRGGALLVVASLALFSSRAFAVSAGESSADDLTGGSCPLPASSGLGSPNFSGKFGVQIAPSCIGREHVVDRAFEDAMTVGLKCLATRNISLFFRFIKQLGTKTTEIQCLNPIDFTRKRGELNEDDNGAKQSGGNHDCALGEVKGTRIFLHPAAFHPPSCGPLAGVLFHEYLHNIGVLTSPAHAPGDLVDSVYGCELSCFGPKPVPPPREAACSNAKAP
jgi:hypothetical protein